MTKKWSSTVLQYPTAAECRDLLIAERKAHKLVIGYGPQNAKLARYYEVRALGLEALLREIEASSNDG